MFRRNLTPIGLEIKSGSIRMVQLERTINGWSLQEMQVRKYTSDEQGEEGLERQRVIDQIRDCLKEGSFSGRSAVSVLPEEKVDIIPIEVAPSKDEDFDSAVVREARSYLAYDLENAVIDYLPVAGSLETPERAKDEKILLIAAKREDVDDHLSLLGKAKLKPLAIDIRAAALARLFPWCREGSGKNRLVMNMDEQTTSLTLLRQGSVFAVRTIPWGRSALTEALYKSLKLEHKRSEDLLSKIGVHSKLAEDGAGGGQERAGEHRMYETLHEITAPELESLAREIDKVLIYFLSENRGGRIDEFHLTGLSSLVRNLPQYLEERTNTPASLLDPLKALGLDRDETTAGDPAGGGPFWGVPLGLALRGSEPPASEAVPEIARQTPLPGEEETTEKEEAHVPIS